MDTDKAGTVEVLRKIRRGQFVRDPDLDGPIGELIDVVNHHGEPIGMKWQRGAAVRALLDREELAKSWAWFHKRRTNKGVTSGKTG